MMDPPTKKYDKFIIIFIPLSKLLKTHNLNISNNQNQYQKQCNKINTLHKLLFKK